MFSPYYNNSFISRNFINSESTSLDSVHDDVIDEPYMLGRAILTEIEIKAIAERISDKLIKIVEQQLSEV